MIKQLSSIKFRTDAEHVKPWVMPVGSLVLNFATIEMQTYWWLGLLLEAEDAAEILRWTFKRRVDKIIRLSETRLQYHPNRFAIVAAWTEALEIAKFRNAIVHNPIVFAWDSEEVGEPDFIGIPDVSHLGSKPPTTKRMASKADINQRVDDTGRLARLLLQLLRDRKGMLLPGVEYAMLKHRHTVFRP